MKDTLQRFIPAVGCLLFAVTLCAQSKAPTKSHRTLPKPAVMPQSIADDAEIAANLPAYDRGPRPGYMDMDDTPLPGATSMDQLYFWRGWENFKEPRSVQYGLGPRFNGLSCADCHSHPAMGGSSPMANPYDRIARDHGASNELPRFASGAIKVARFLRHADGSPDGGVHNLFVVSGRSDLGQSGACQIAQPDFETAIAEHNVAYRQVTPIFGAGLMEAIEDSEIIANKQKHLSEKKQLGIGGHENVDSHGVITRFGWKAQESLRIFTADAMVTELGESNQLFPHKRSNDAGCYLSQNIPDDREEGDVSDAWSLNDLQSLVAFQRFLAVPSPVAPTALTDAGRLLFEKTGCQLCHTQSLKTADAFNLAMGNKTVNLYSDLLVHDMGEGLADGITQGKAGPREFRTAPLWGLGRRLWFLHDGLAEDLVIAIGRHASPGSEANAVVENYRRLSPKDQQAILDFLRSL